MKVGPTRYALLTLYLTIIPAIAHVTTPARTLASSGRSARHVRVCADVPLDVARCHAILVVPASGQATPDAISPQGYVPSDLQSAYDLPSATGGSGQTVAVVDAYDDPNAEADLGVYRARFGLPPCATANGCFHKADQSGGTAYPRADASWAQEISLDLDMVSAVCPQCHILLVEASAASLNALGAAVNTAVRLGATAISNSYGGAESGHDRQYDARYYNHPGIAITASSGDGGYGTQYPAASPYVTAVGGTTFVTDTTTARGWSETAWAGAGSGCSAYEPKSAWQTDAGCAKRTIGDVAAVADPATGVAAYDSDASPTVSGWLVFGGTSVAAPLIAGVYALAGNAGGVTYGAYPYSYASSLHDINGGGSGRCGVPYLCTAGPGYDGPTGLGTPDGVGAF